MVPGLSCSTASGIFPCLLHSQGGLFTSEPPGKPRTVFFTRPETSPGQNPNLAETACITLVHEGRLLQPLSSPSSS